MTISIWKKLNFYILLSQKNECQLLDTCHFFCHLLESGLARINWIRAVYQFCVEQLICCQKCRANACRAIAIRAVHPHSIRISLPLKINYLQQLSLLFLWLEKWSPIHWFSFFGRGLSHIVPFLFSNDKKITKIFVVFVWLLRTFWPWYLLVIYAQLDCIFISILHNILTVKFSFWSFVAQM